MQRNRHFAISFAVGTAFLLGAEVMAQQVQITTPYHSINDSFYENFGVGWAPIFNMGNNGGWYFSGIPANSTPPPFGGYDPAADSRFGFKLGPLGFNFLAGQGSNRSHVMQAPTIVIPNGGTGFLFDGSVSPFVMGVIPVVGNAPMTPVATSPLAERLERLQQAEEQRLAAEAAARAAGDDDAELAEALRAPPGEPTQDDAPLVMRGGRVVEPEPLRAEGTSGSVGGSTDRGDGSPD